MLEINPVTFAHNKAHFLLSGVAGDIEVTTTSPKNISQSKVIIICHPHPLHGGTMDNKVVTTLMRTFNELGFKTVRFNFRGVGLSMGEHESGIGESDDLVTVLDWVAQVLPNDEVWLAGFSFGAYVAYRGATLSAYKDTVKQLVLIAPPASYPEFKELPVPKMPWLVVQGEADEVVAPDIVFTWLQTIGSTAKLIRMSATSHFFHGKLIDLKNELLKVFQ